MDSKLLIYLSKRLKINFLDKKQPKTIPQIIAVSKTFPLDKIIPLLEAGHFHFGENKIQEAESKWIDVKKKYTKVQLHMLGKLQTNKVKKAVKLFDYCIGLKKCTDLVNIYASKCGKIKLS